MVFRPSFADAFLSRETLARAAVAGFMVLGALTLPTQAALLPEGFFDMQVSPGDGPAAVEADRLNYNAVADLISAEGDVLFSYQGYTIRADRLEYNQRTGDLLAIGSVKMRDPTGSIYESDRIEVTGRMKEAFFDSLTLTTAQGAVISARDVRYSAELATILTEASYSPCGLCVDEKGRRIGWQVKSARMIYDRERASVTLEQPSLELLGMPVAWLPWFWVPDPTQPRATGLRMPSVNYSPKRGAELTVPFFVPVGEDVDIILSPTLMSRQGFLAKADGTWRFPGFGQIDVKASGLYQLDPSAYAGLPGDRNWRGAIQTSGAFTPAEDWKVGWSYTVFSDNAYLADYDLSDDDSAVNQVYGTYLTDQTWLDARIQQFNRIGNYNASDEQKQGMHLPKVTGEHVQDLEPGWGRIRIGGELLSVRRGADQTATYNGVDYDWGYAGTKVHGMVEGGWEDQMIMPGGVAFTPYLGLRLDGTFYDGASADPSAPPPSSLFSATPIAAMDVRWPLMGEGLGGTNLVEPIAQIVWRGSSTTDVGITNDDAHSFVFDTSNLFSYNRFSGIDRQETGLRANIGGHYLGSFDDGSWIDLVAGQSFHLAGLNALGVNDQVNVGAATGLDATASYMVASARGGFSGGLSGGVKVQVDPNIWRISRAGVGVNYAPPSWFSVGMDYLYIAATPTLGIVDDQHEISGRGKVTLWDYWSVNGGLAWDLDSGSWSSATTGIEYDDGYLAVGGSGTFKPGGDWSVGFSLKLKGPDGELAF